MKRHIIVVGLLLCCAAGVACAARQGRYSIARTPSPHLLFNPTWTGLPPTEMGRSTWPATTSFAPNRETVNYRTTVYDRQGGRGHLGGNNYARRFLSTRTGNATR